MRLNLLFYLIIILLFSSNSYAYKKGKGQLSISENTADVLEYYFSGGTKGKWAEPDKANWDPWLIAVSEDGHYYYLIRQPKRFQPEQADSRNYSTIAIKKCEAMAKEDGYPQECFLFAKKRKIVWDNGSDKKRRRLSKSDIKNGKTIAILKELNFYNGKISQKSNKKESNNKSASNNEIVNQLEALKKLFDDGVISKDEFEKAKKKILN